MKKELDFYFKTYESPLTCREYQIILKNGKVSEILERRYAREDSTFRFMWEYPIHSMENIYIAFYHLAKSDVEKFKKMYNILFEHDSEYFKIAETVLEKIQQEYNSIFELPF